MLKRIFSLFLAIALLFGALPVLSAAEPQKRTLTVRLIGADAVDALRVYQGEVLISEQAVQGSEVTFALPAGEYTYFGVSGSTGHGSGPFTVSDCEDAQTLTLRSVDLTSYALSNSAGTGYTVHMESADGVVYFAGSTDAENGGLARGWFLLPASPEGTEYRYAFMPTDESAWGSYGTTWLYSTYVGTAERNFKGLPASQSDTGTFLIAPKTTATFSVPNGATLRVCHRVKFYEPLEVLKPVGAPVVQNGQCAYTYEIPDGVMLHYELELDGYVKKAATFRGQSAITVTTENLTPETLAALLPSAPSSVLTNAPDSHYIELNVGERFELYLHRVQQAVNSGTENYYIDPDYRIEVLSGSSVSVTESYYAGAVLCADSTGVTVLRIGAEALDFVDAEGNDCIYGATEDKNAAILVVNVGGNGAAKIDSGCGGREHEVQYFIRSLNGTFAPEQTASVCFAPSENVTAVSLHRPEASWEDWSVVPTNGDGSFTAALSEGSNVLRFQTADGAESYHVLRAMGLDVTVSSASDTLRSALNENGISLIVDTNDELTIHFDGLKMPLPKLAALINPGLSSAMTEMGYQLVPSTYVQYTQNSESAEETIVCGESSQYGIAEKNALTLSYALPGTYTLSSGALHTTYFGLGEYVGISKGGYTGMQPTYFNGINTELDSRNALYGALPEIRITAQAVVSSSDAGVKGVSVSGTVATANGTQWSAILPYGSVISADSAAVVVTPSHPLAKVSTPVTSDGGKTWRFTVTAQDGTVQSYTVAVRVSTACVRVTFHLNGGTCAELGADVTTIDYTAQQLGAELPVPEKEGWIFMGWYDGNDRSVQYQTVTADLPTKLYALWREEHISGILTVTFQLIGSTRAEKPIDFQKHPNETYGAQRVVWIPTTTCHLPAGSTVYDLLLRALDDHGMTQSGAENNYVRTINGLSEFANGSYSGWKYSVNGVSPNVALKDYALSGGDVVVWYYTNDYRYDGLSDGADESDAVREVERLIDAIGMVALSAVCREKLDAARSAYRALSAAAKQRVTNYAVLEAAEQRYAELQQISDREQAKKVEEMIAKLPTQPTPDDLEKIEAARAAYDALTMAQKALVSNASSLTAAEAALARITATEDDRTKANEVTALIAQLGEITEAAEPDIRAARSAYDALSELQKQLVENVAVLEAAEAQLAQLQSRQKISDVLRLTGAYLQTIGTPMVGSIGGEWMAIGLLRAGCTLSDEEAYYDNIVAYVREHADENGRLHPNKATENARLILALTAMGRDVTDVDGHDLLRALNDMDYVCKQGLNGPVWTLIALDSAGYPEPTGNVTRAALIESILDAELSGGGWSLYDDEPDADATAMALQALAPYCAENAEVQTAVEQAVALLSAMQRPDGGFATETGAGPLDTCESVAQVVTALSALGIDADADERFRKNGCSALDALLDYFVEGGGFCHTADGSLDGMATEQAYYALAAYVRMQNGQTRLYDMTDVFDRNGSTAQTPDSAPTNEVGLPTWCWIAIVLGALLILTVIAVLAAKKRSKK